MQARHKAARAKMPDPATHRRFDEARARSDSHEMRFSRFLVVDVPDQVGYCCCRWRDNDCQARKKKSSALKDDSVRANEPERVAPTTAKSR